MGKFIGETDTLNDIYAPEMPVDKVSDGKLLSIYEKPIISL